MPTKNDQSTRSKWEQQRRNRLNDSFTDLSKLLPCYNPSKALSKIDILVKSASFIEELQKKLNDYLTANVENKPEQAELKQLYARVKNLIRRNEQLGNLLKDAGISIPCDGGPVKFGKKKRKWSNKITMEKAEVINKLELKKVEKEKDTTVKKPKPRSPKGKIVTKGKLRKFPLKKQKVVRKNANILVSTANLVQNVVTIANVQPCYLITNGLTTNLTANVGNRATTVVTNSTLLSTPILSTTTKTQPVVTKPNSFPTGAIILTNNLPVVQPPTLINPPIILNSNPANAFIVVKNTPATKSSTTPKTGVTKTVTPILPKRSITKTTHINKVPIPASRHASDYILLSNVPKLQPVKKPKSPKKPVKRKIAEPEVPIEAKTLKTDESKEVVLIDKKEEGKKVATSDYSIDSICKDKSEVPVEKITTDLHTVADSTTTTVLSNSQQSLIATNSQTTTVFSQQSLTVADNKTTTVFNNSQQIKDVVPLTVVEVIKEIPTTTTMVIAAPITAQKIQEVVIKDKEVVAPNKQPDISDTLIHSELSNDLFASLQVPSGSQNPESTSPTAAFLNAFPLVSSFTGVKVTEVMEDETSDSHQGTPTLLQIGTIDTKPTQPPSDSLTPNLLNLDSFSFFPSKDICTSLYNPFDNIQTTTTISSACKSSKDISVITKTAKILYDTAVSDTDCLRQSVVTKIATTISTVVTNISKQLPIITSNTMTNNTYSNSNNYLQTFFDNTHVVTTASTQPITSYVVDNKIKTNEKPSCSRNTSYNLPEYNTFNPFTDLPKSTVVCCYSSTKTYNQPIYTNNTNCNYNYQSEFNNSYNKNGNKADKYYNYENYDNTNYNYYNTNQVKVNKTKPNEHVPRPPVNWMTAPDLKQQSSDFPLPQFTKDPEFTPNIYSQNTFVTNSQSTYFNTTAPIYPNTNDFHTFTDGKKLDPQFNNSFQQEEHQFSWSPTKMPQLLDPPHNFVSTTLPTLVGDLALGNTQCTDKMKKSKDRRNNQQYDNTSNFLSVSQLVDHTKSDNVARITTRRNSGGRAKSNTAKSPKRANKPTEIKETIQNYSKTIEKNHIKPVQLNYNEPPTVDWVDAKRVKNPPSSYSAEALIGHPTQVTPTNITNKQRPTQQNYSKTLPVPSFFPDITYFPPVDDNNFTQQNQNYQNNAFSFPSSIQNNTFIPNPTTTYLPSTNYIPDIAEYNPIIPENIFSHANPKPPDQKYSKTQQTKPTNKHIFNNTPPKKSKKKSTNETTPGFVDFSFLSMPGAINSPILPDDFHTHTNFLPPRPNTNQLYPCKNPLYPKQSGDIGTSLLPIPPVSNTQHTDISTSINNVGTSLTNFNLSTIFPEINKSTVPDMYLDTAKGKDYGLQRSYLPPSSQIPSFSKGPIYSTITTQAFLNN